MLGGVAVASLWPLSAYALNPVVLPSLVALAAIGAVVLARPEFGIAVVLVLAPFTNLRVGTSGTKPFHLLIPALAIGMLVYGALVVRGSRRSISPMLQFSTLAFVVVGIAASLHGLDPHGSITKLFLLITAVALFFGVLECCRDRSQLTVVVGGALLGLLFASLQGIEQHLTHRTGAGFLVGTSYVGRVQGSFGHPNQYGGFLAFLLPLAIAVLFSRSFSFRMRTLAAAATAAAIPAITFSYARGAILALMVGGLIWLVLIRPRYALAAAAVIAVSAAFLAPPALKERFNTQSASSAVPLRADIWGGAIDIYSRYPILGVGLNNFSEAYAQLPSTLANASQRRLLNQSGLLIPPHAQNLYLNTMAEEGIVGLASLVVLLLTALWTAFRATRLRDPVGRVLGIGAGAGLLTLMVHGVLEVTLISELALPFFALLASAAVALSLQSTGDEATVSVPVAPAAEPA